MATIHMDIEAVRNIQRSLLSTQEHIARLIRPVDMTVHNLPPHWRSHATEEFMAEYEVFQGNMSRVLSELGEIADEIESEADRWERVADKF